MSALEGTSGDFRPVRKRIFVVGVPRSGTTLVQSFLAAHPLVTSFTESHLFSRFFRMLTAQRALLLRDPSARFEEFLVENGVEVEEAARRAAAVGRVARARALRPLRGRAVAELLLLGLDRLAVERGKDVWVEKTPMHLRYAPWLEALITDRDGSKPQFVHVVRRGPETAASLFLASQSWETAYDLPTCAERWNEDVEFSAGLLDRPDHHVVFYEELTTTPVRSLKVLAEALALPWEPAVLEGYGGAASSLTTPSEFWKDGTGRALETSNSSWMRLSQSQRDEVGKSIRPGAYEDLYALHRGKPPRHS